MGYLKISIIPHTKHFVYRKIQALAGYMADLTEVTRKLGLCWNTDYIIGNIGNVQLLLIEVLLIINRK